MSRLGCWTIGVGCWLLAACSSHPTNVSKVDQLPEIYPDYIGVTVPVDIAPLNFNFADEAIDGMDVVVKGSKGGEIHSNGEWADFNVRNRIRAVSWLSQ